MYWLKKLVSLRLTSDRLDRKFGQWVCFAMCSGFVLFRNDGRLSQLHDSGRNHDRPAGHRAT